MVSVAFTLKMSHKKVQMYNYFLKYDENENVPFQRKTAVVGEIYQLIATI